MGNILQSLKAVSTKRSAQASPIARRRNVLLKTVHEQIEAAKARTEGKQYSVKELRHIRDPQTGARKELLRERYVREAWWVGEDGRLLFELRYGMKPVEFSKGKSTIDVGDWAHLIPTLEKLKQAVQAGELDEQLNVVAGRLTAQLKPKTVVK